ncbi:hypothetical protein GGR51DRAFT_567733 [Nemania sp. FL0031]|nr:hypothetical protein GGR51DRAFT_567733 [Nemania sp. FL0031]
MEEASPVQRLTRENLRRLEGKDPDLQQAKRQVADFLGNMGRMGHEEAKQIRKGLDVYMASTISVRYRGNAVPQPDVLDPSFWKAKLKDLEDKYKRVIDFEGAKRDVYYSLRDIYWYCGSEGRRIIADYELYIAGELDVRYRGDRNPGPNLEDTTYWEDHSRHLESIWWRFKSAKIPLLPSPTPGTLNTEEMEEQAKMERTQEYIRNWPQRKKAIELWVDGTHDTGNTGDILSVPCSPVFHPLSDIASLDGIEDTVGRPVEITRTGRWRLARLSVYDRMVALWHLGGEGREIIENDELHIADRYNIRYKRDRSPRPNLQDPTYWEAKLEYFTDKLVSLLRAKYAEDDSPLLPWLGLYDEDRDRLPIPSPASNVLSTAFSVISRRRPSPASEAALEISRVQRRLYEILTEDFFQNEGRQILENDEIYIAGAYDVRYRQKSGPLPDLKDPAYWRQKNDYFRLEHMKHTQSLGMSLLSFHIHPATSQPSGPTQSRPPSHGRQSYSRAPDIENTVHETASVQNAINQNSSITAQSGIIDTQITEPSRGSKRKRDAHFDDINQHDDNGALHATKRRKSCARQANAVPTTTTEDSPNVAEPQPRRKQRKTYEKTRRSRRIAGQLPEFGLLLNRGDELLPYEGPTQVPPHPSKTSGPDLRARRRPNKPMATKGAKPRGISKPVQEKASRPKRLRGS